MNNYGTLVALAWPDTWVRKVGRWYDVPMKWIGIQKNNCYKAGHAALLLINHISGDVYYFDFGRYHTPIKKGRIRDQITDPDLTVRQKVIFNNNNQIRNLKNILLEVAENPSTHGKGKMLASVYSNIRFNDAYQKAKIWQKQDAIPYGPFDIKGTNCSRFVLEIAKSSDVHWLTKLLFAIPYTFSPTPLFNIRIINKYAYFFEINNNIITVKRIIPMWLQNIIYSKEKPLPDQIFIPVEA